MTDTMTINSIAFLEGKSTQTGKIRSSITRGLDTPDSMETMHQVVPDKRNGGTLSRHTVKFVSRYAKVGGGYYDLTASVTLTVPESTTSSNLLAMADLIGAAITDNSIVTALANNES